MAEYIVRFHATLERRVEVPDGMDWSEAYRFVEQTWGWADMAQSPRTRVVRISSNHGPLDFIKVGNGA